MYKTIEDEWSPNNNFEDDKIDQFICHASLGLLFLRDTAVTTKMTHHFVIYSFVIHIDFYLEQDGDHWC